jgi:hypothetical protein
MAPNPPFGAVFTYYLAESLQTRQEQRRQAEKEIARKGGDTPHPGWDALRLEAREEDPAILFTVRDADGNVVRRLSGPVSAGFHRVAWDLRFPATTPPPYGGETFFLPAGGPLAAPGRYSVSMAKQMNGVVTAFGQTQTFDVVPLREGTLPRQAPTGIEEFLREVAELQRSVSGAEAALERGLEVIGLIKQALLSSTVSDSTLGDETRALELRLLDLREAINGDNQRQGIGEPVPPSISQRLQVALMGTAFSTYGPTATHRRSFEIARDEFTTVRERINQALQVDMVDLEKKLEAAGVPWTPGRAVPAMND